MKDINEMAKRIVKVWTSANCTEELKIKILSTLCTPLDDDGLKELAAKIDDLAKEG